VTDLQFFSTPLLLGANGIEANLGMGTLIDFEQEALEKMKPELSGSIAKGIEFANK
jgi:malate dehydrogenase